ncbi:MAG TPA: reverse transcriptase family protein [Kofleriaceae bacterium]|nr:reverse transcriptase family protein [Kofleriaceae bacterium]
MADAAIAVQWADVEAAGGIREWVDAEVARQGLAFTGVPSGMSDAEKKQFKARREEERRVRRELYKRAWLAYKRSHIVHLGPGVFWHDTADVDRFDADDPEKKRQDNALPKLGDVDALAKALGLTVPRMRWLAFHRDVDTGTHYVRWTVPKRDGTPRLISAPKPELKAAQRWITREITEHLPVHGAAHGFLKDRSIVTNAIVHAGARIVVKLDILGFYPTVTMRRVKGLLRRAGLGEQVATLCALLATESPREEVVTHGKVHYVAVAPRSLPQGAPTSPSITNALCLRMDCRLSGLARKLGCRYTRYADDLTFSWHGKDKSDVGALLRAVRMIVRAEGFEIHTKKTRVMRSGARQKVTGLVVNAAKDRPPARVPRVTQRQLRAAIKNRELGRPGKGDTLEQLKGMAAFIMMTDRERGAAFMARIDRLIAARDATQTPTGEGNR